MGRPRDRHPDTLAYQRAALAAQLDRTPLRVSFAVTEAGDGAAAWSWSFNDRVAAGRAHAGWNAADALLDGFSAVRRSFCELPVEISIAVDDTTRAVYDTLVAGYVEPDPIPERPARSGQVRPKIRIDADQQHLLRVRSVIRNGNHQLVSAEEPEARRAAKQVRRTLRQQRRGSQARWTYLPHGGRPPASMARSWARQNSRVVRYTDGTSDCSGQPAWAWYQDPSAWAAGLLPRNPADVSIVLRAELEAARQAILSAPADQQLLVVTDHEAVAKSIEGWNVPDAGVELHELALSVSARAVLVKGHRDKMQHKADRRAARAARRRSSLGAAA